MWNKWEIPGVIPFWKEPAAGNRSPRPGVGPQPEPRPAPRTVVPDR